ncbi:TraB family protein [Tsuneonella dongtanensis]|uniref:TraB family protein n=1 Tax=Tsuneonella dongtanensis TaxID=692370 RepID=A0A1B2AFK7_9SPHN|nr:TraB/GumN family protein [Tsuneonella dongtanensis]ANY20815.1 TraB family protein [Tsuneonella dongtanensis]
MTIARYSRAILTAGAALTLLAGCATAHAEVPTPAASSTAAPATVGPALWKVSDEDTTIYLFGTVHVLPEGGTWFDDRIAGALAASGSIVTELPQSALTDPSAQTTIMGLAMLPADKSLRAMLSDEQRTTYEAALGKLKIPPQSFDRFEPWFAAMTLSMLPLLQNGYKVDSGVEKVLESKAGPNMKRDAVETLEGQLKLFDELPVDAQAAYLASVSAKIDEVVPGLNDMVAAWEKGDADKLAELMNEAMKDDPALADRLLYARNRNWAQWIDDRLDQPGTVFMAVGAGHLAGSESVQAALAARGIQSVRVQ